MIYVLYGENNYEIDEFINKLIKDNNIDSKIVYNYPEDIIDNVIEEALYNDLFGSKKIVIYNNSTFLTGKNTLESKTLDNYIENPNENTFLIFKVNESKLDERKKIVKTLKEKSKVMEFKLLDEKDMPSFIRKYFENLNYKIDYNAVNEIVSRINTNSKVLVSELDKLYLYKINDKTITINDVKDVVTKYEDDTKIYKLVNAVINKDKASMFIIYKELIDNKEEPIALIALIANQLRLILECSILKKDGLSNKDISSKLKEHPYRIELAIKETYSISDKKLRELLLELADIDLKIKTGEIVKEDALETFFLKV